MLNILRIVYDFSPPWFELGPGTYELSKAQVKLGNRVTVFAGEWPKQRGYTDNGLVVERLLRCFPYIGGFFTYSPIVLLKYLMVDRKKIDLIHGHNFHPLWYYMYRKIFGDKKPLVLHMHITSAERTHRNQCASFITKNLEWRLSIAAERLGCELADAIICVSESVKEEVLKWYRPSQEKVFVVSNGVNIELFNPAGANLKKELGLQDSKVILFVGVLNKRKKINLLIESLAYLPKDYKLLIIGEGPDKKELMRSASRLNLLERVIFRGFIPYPQMDKYYRTADIFVLTSIFEGLPKVVLEALACGVPVITSKSFKPDIFLAEQIFQLDDIAPVKIAAKIQEVIQKGQKPNAELIKNSYDWKVVAKKIQSIYGRL